MEPKLDRRELLAGVLGASALAALSEKRALAQPSGQWVTAATWPHGLAAVKRSAELLASGKNALEAVEKGTNVVEDDPSVDSVGKGGLPNRDGVVQLDAAIMRGSDCLVGAVAGLEKIRNPVSVARHVLEATNHVLLVGEGALAFARSKNFVEEDLLTDHARAEWEKWKAASAVTKDPAPKKDHDTVGVLALDPRGELAVAVSTSGLAWKLPGRVGDSPIVGAGLYADASVGGAASTGIGEEVLRVAGSFLVVEGMRRGLEPLEAIKEALLRIKKNPPRIPGARSRQVAFIALRKDGAVAGLSLEKGFSYAIARPGEEPKMVEAGSLD